jgi:hypothetical protein
VSSPLILCQDLRYAQAAHTGEVMIFENHDGEEIAKIGN